MGKITIQKETTLQPITLIGMEAGVCYGSDISDPIKNYKRGIMNINSGHGRTFEFPQVFVTIEGYSARCLRELYTHIGGAPTRLQSSTRYIDYENFGYITPPSIKNNIDANMYYEEAMDMLSDYFNTLRSLGIPKEDIANILPLGMTSKMVLRTNARNLIDMSRNRLCTRAYWEFRELMNDLMQALSEYSEEWKELVEMQFKPKCEILGYCTEHNSCGRKPSKVDFDINQNNFINKEREIK